MAWQRASAGLHVQAQNFPRLALDDYLERPAADLAIGRESLRMQTGIYNDLERLPAKRTLDGLRNFHQKNLVRFLVFCQTKI